MAKGVNIYKKELVKQNIKKGLSYKQSLLQAGYTQCTAKQASRQATLKYSLEEIAKEFDKSKITAEYVLAGLEKELSTALKPADRLKALELLGKYLAMFTDKQQVKAEILNKEEQDTLNRYININRQRVNQDNGI